MRTEFNRFERIIEIEGRSYNFIRGSDVTKDGMYLEVCDEERAEVILFAFFSDADGSFICTAYKENLPFALVEQFVKSARAGLPPMNNKQTDSD